MKQKTDAYTLKFHSHNRTAVMLCLLALMSVMPAFGQQTDTLLYRYHYAGHDGYPGMMPEDSYMELHMRDGVLTGGMFWGTTDMMDDAREGYLCGFFVLPMTDIIYGSDSISFSLKVPKDKRGELTNVFTNAPVDLDIRRWEEAIDLYGPWESFTPTFNDSVRLSIRPAQKGEKLLSDSVIVHRWMFSDERITFFRKQE